MSEIEWLDGNELSVNIWRKKYCYNNETFNDWLDRVSGKNEYIKKLICDKKFLFGGRTLANRGINRGSNSNCYSIGYVPDSLDSIMDVAKDIAMTFKVQGGQGLSLSKIRPKGSLIHGEFKSDGIIPFMEIFNTVTQSISQGGSRKGALMMSLDINHEESETFMKVKSDLKKITHANLSLEIDDNFMRKVKDGSEKEVNKFKLLAEQACKYAEPGVIFTNKFRNYNLMQYVTAYNIETCNPCGEQPLPKHGACNLCSINISEYVIDPFTKDSRIDYETLNRDVREIVKAMDDVLTENLPNHALEEQREMAEQYRNIGIGIMGLHDALIKMGIIYGSNEAVNITGNIMKELLRDAVVSSVELAKERGNFPGYDEMVWDADILKQVFTDEEISQFKKDGYLRNCSLLSVAPTGSIGTMLNISTGVEPFFDTSYTRKTISLDGQEQYYKVDVPVIEEAKKHGINEKCLITSNDIEYHDRINMQAIMQKYVDTAISSTINLPKTTKPSDIEKLYYYAWESGLKGVTIYVDGSRDPILSNGDTQKQDNECKCNCQTTLTHSAPKRPKSLPCDVKRFRNGGEKWISCVGLFNGQPYEIFTGLSDRLNLPEYVSKCSIIKNKFDQEVYNEETGKNEITKVSRYDLVYSDKNGDIQFIENIGNIFRSEFYNVSKMTSALLRHGMPIEYVISTIKSLDFKDNTINSWKSGVIRTLKGYIKDGEIQGEVCPECGEAIVRENGCKHCSNPECGWSACS